VPATAHHINTLIELLSCPLEEAQPDADREIVQMKQAAQEQENKMKELTKNTCRDRPKMLLTLKRKISECT
jgi:hypothetical protein